MKRAMHRMWAMSVVGMMALAAPAGRAPAGPANAIIPRAAKTHTRCTVRFMAPSPACPPCHVLVAIGFRRMLKNSLLPRLLKKVQMQGGARCAD